MEIIYCKNTVWVFPETILLAQNMLYLSYLDKNTMKNIKLPENLCKISVWEFFSLTLNKKTNRQTTLSVYTVKYKNSLKLSLFLLVFDQYLPLRVVFRVS